MSNRVCLQMLKVSSNGTVVNRLFVSKECMYIYSLNVSYFAKFVNIMSDSDNLVIIILMLPLVLLLLLLLFKVLTWYCCAAVFIGKQQTI